MQKLVVALSLLVAACGGSPVESAAPALAPGHQTLTVDGHGGFAFVPATTASGNPWVWYAPVIAPSLPDANEAWMFAELDAAGVTVAGVDVGESYGNAAGRVVFTAFYEHMVSLGFSARPRFLARSRGGLQAYNWAAEHPSSVARIGGIYPVGDLLSYPGADAAAMAYGETVDAFVADLPSNDPIDRLGPLEAAGISLMHVHGDSDTVVPLEANSQVIHDRYVAMGGKMTLEVVPGAGHDFDVRFFQSQALVDFLVR